MVTLALRHGGQVNLKDQSGAPLLTRRAALIQKVTNKKWLELLSQLKRTAATAR